MSSGHHEPVKNGTPGHEIITHLSEALGYNVLEIQQMIRNCVNPYRCHYCPAAYGIKIELQEHMKEAHRDAKTIPCLQCEKLFNSTATLQSHIRIKHMPKKVKEFRCMVAGCNKEYATLKTFQVHIAKIHPEVTLQMNPVPSTSAQGETMPNQVEIIIPDAVAPTERGRGRGKASGGVFGKQA